MTIKDFEKVNCSSLTLYTIRNGSNGQVIKQIRVDYDEPFDVWIKQNAELNRFLCAKVLMVDHGNNCIAVFAEVVY